MNRRKEGVSVGLIVAAALAQNEVDLSKQPSGSLKDTVTQRLFTSFSLDKSLSTTQIW